MAEDAGTSQTASPTEYRIFRKLTDDQIAGLGAGHPDGEDADVYVLEPNTYTGNVKRSVYDDLGEGDYIKVSARSLDQFAARTKSVVTFSE